ncbi:PREDICTED: TGF-beta-activated kinase 1 and MAP3K7-binding protein 1-like [Branchiostoma belcheri]|uniref:TGF-beta-activated kinase 1 and MAP3K7-binding protein 1 n=1 Tax=Branchiostoma belcheri TaxID=7741 RepID=A0A6P4ZX60_BRABE|nr:PREDICTED: TGF-beta-activated kinase 1 and MAP3K7-binding protein 1-like [Branchiostoma belcheri]KAI8479174.1 PHOsphatase [Branchiostoma belcheri]KAI8487421.1 PHOsphatase [Branchiostoma belcheri]
MTSHRASTSSTLSSGSATPRGLGHAPSWTDDLPVCPLSGVGSSTNQTYRLDGLRQEEHPFEDRCFHFRHESDVYLYGVFDGHDGNRASDFATQRMPAELLLGQLDKIQTDRDVKMALHQAFLAVDKAFFEAIDDYLCEKTTLQLELPEGMSDYEVYQQYPQLVDKLHALDEKITGGTTAVVALILNSKLYVANAGDSRAVLCKTKPDSSLEVVQLSNDHVIDNPDETLRLSQLGLNMDLIRSQGSRLGNQDCTRTLGNYHLKGGYKDFDILSVATAEPVIAEPDVVGGITVDESCSFLMLFSDGLYKSLEKCTGTDSVNRDLAYMVSEELGNQSTLNSVAQAVVDRVVRLHHDTFMRGGDHARLCAKRPDIMLIVRNFNHPFPNALTSPTQGGVYNPVSVPYRPHKNEGPPPKLIMPPKQPVPTNLHETSPTTTVVAPATNQSPVVAQQSPSATMSEVADTNVTQTTGTTSSDTERSGPELRLFRRRQRSYQPLTLDDDGLVEPYVDFSDFHQRWNEFMKTQKEHISSLQEEKEPSLKEEPDKELEEEEAQR